MNEKPLVMKMREEYRFFGGMSLLYGLIFAFCLYKNMHGITFPICVGATIGFAVLFMKKINFRLQKHSLLYIIGMMLLGVSTALTTSFFLHFFNIVGIILLFFVLMIHQFYNDRMWNFPTYIKRIFKLFGTILSCIPYPFAHGGAYFSKSQNRRKQTIAAIVLGFCIALGILCVVLPLLLKSDMIFSKIFGEILKYINFSTIIGIGSTIILGFILCYAFFAALCKYNFPRDERRNQKYYNPIVGITFTSIISAIYLLYCMIQIMYLFIGIEKGLPVDVTYSEYARGGFWELLFVSIVNFIMVLLCMYLFGENMVLKVVLTIISGCTFIMIFSAGYRIFLYVSAYCLTFLRLLVIWFLIVLLLIMAGVVISIYGKRFPLFYYIVAVVSVCYIGFSFLRPDAVIANYNIAHSEQMKQEDVLYLMDSLSIDAAPAIAKIDMRNYEEFVQERAYGYFRNISEQNEGIYFRKANYSRIRAKLAADKYLGTEDF